MVFGAWMIGFHLVALTYLCLVIAYQDSFDVRIRLPSLTIAEVLIIQLCATTVCLREIFVANGWLFPPAAQDASFIGALLMMIVFAPLRCLQLIIVFDPSIRSAYHRHFQLLKGCFVTSMVVLSVVFYSILINGYSQGCLSR